MIFNNLDDKANSVVLTKTYLEAVSIFLGPQFPQIGNAEIGSKNFHWSTSGQLFLQSCFHTCVYVPACMLSRVWLLAAPWTVARQVSLSKGFSRQETGVGYHFLFQGIFSDSGIEPMSPALQADSLSLHHLGSLPHLWNEVNL